MNAGANENVKLSNDPEKDLHAGKRHCEACGEWVDKTGKKCPECAGPFAYRVSEATIVKVSTVVFTIFTVFFFVLAVFWSADITKVEDIDEARNFEILRIKGTVIDSPDYYPNEYDDSGTMRVWINDTTGEIQIYFDEITTELLIESGEIPGLGDTVEAMGRVSYSKDSDTMKVSDITISGDGISVSIDTSGEDAEIWAYRSMSVENENNFEILGNNYQVVPISDIEGKGKNAFEERKKVLISGTVVSSVTNYDTAYQFTICDESSPGLEKLIVYVPKDIVELSGVELESQEDLTYNLLAGSRVSILGSMTYYESAYGPMYSKWELIPTSVGKAKQISGRYCFEIEDEGTGFSVENLLSNPEIYEGEDVVIHSAVFIERDGKTFIKDVGGTNELMVFCYDPLDIADGAIVDLEGEFLDWEGTWEIKIYDAQDIREVK